MAVIRRPGDGALLVTENPSWDGTLFHRPLGGHVEFGERAAATLHRELREEIGQELTGVRQLGVLENIFIWDGVLQHEVVFIYQAAFADPAAYAIEEQPVRDEPDDRVRVIWRPAAAAGPPLYPDGLPALIEQTERQGR
jgi:ADP-ribose pyrophosphatase YjhB (NUDIX family)